MKIIVARAKLRVQRTLLFGPYYFGTKLFVGHRGWGVGMTTWATRCGRDALNVHSVAVMLRGRKGDESMG